MAVAAGLFLAAALATGLWLANSGVAVEAAMPDPVREAYLEREFEEYYSSQPAAQFASLVFTNNVRVAALAFAGGIAFCLFTVWVLVVNGAHFGLAAGIFTQAGAAGRFYGLVTPHGLVELTAVFIAGGAGLRLGWTIIDPGDRWRRVALAEEARRAITIVMGLVVVFGVAALIEAWVTPSPLGTALRVGIGAVVEVAFLLYLLVQGRAAVARGLTGALGEVTRPPAPVKAAPSP